MDIEIPVLSDLTLLGVVTLTLLITAIDVVGAYLLAAAQGKFDLGYVANWLTSHSLKRVFPIYALALLGTGVEAAGIPAIPPLFVAATVGVGGYLGETVKSIFVNFNDARAVRDETPVPPVGPPTP